MPPREVCERHGLVLRTALDCEACLHEQEQAESQVEDRGSDADELAEVRYERWLDSLGP